MNWLLCHLIGDFIIQNDYMAQNKKHSDLHCFIHIVTYMLPFLFIHLAWWQLLAIAIQHYILDRTMIVGWIMDIKGSKLFREQLHPWSWIITDNILHILWVAFIVWIPTCTIFK